MTVTADNLPAAYAEAEAHREYARFMALYGRRRVAKQHQAHADALDRDIMAMVREGNAKEPAVTDDELMAALMED